MKYRVWAQGRGLDNLTAPFADFGDANAWAVAYAKGPKAAKVKVVSSDGVCVACYLGHGDGKVWSRSDEVGQTEAERQRLASA